MSIKERAKVFEPSENISSSNHSLLGVSQITRDGDSPLSPYQSSEAKLPSSNVKRPPPVPQKSEALSQKFNAASLTKELLGPSRRLPQSNITNNSIPLSNNDDKVPIIINNNIDSNEDSLAGIDKIYDIELHSNSKDKTKDG